MTKFINGGDEWTFHNKWTQEAKDLIAKLKAENHKAGALSYILTTLTKTRTLIKEDVTNLLGFWGAYHKNNPE